MQTIRREGAQWALLIARLMLGSTFIAHGAQKVFGAWGGPGLTGFAQGVAEGGTPLFLGYLAALFEFFGGVLVLFGVLAELGALMIIPVMIVAAFRIHWSNGYFSSAKGFEYPLNLMLICFVILAGGAGKLALWDPLRRWRLDNGSGPTMPVAPVESP